LRGRQESSRFLKKNAAKCFYLQKVTFVFAPAPGANKKGGARGAAFFQQDRKRS
jgi:hypothetical protein